MRVTWTRMPFRFTTTAEYETRLTEYISLVFYELLPAAGYEVREEQIYTAFRIARSMGQGQVLLAEAGLGTGKTFAYLVPAICHARLKGRPVVISSASGVLQEQLASPTGDVALLSRLLDLRIDARLAKDPQQHLCELKVERLRLGGTRRVGLKKMLKWAEDSARGDRAEIPDVPDETWDLIAWDAGLPCDTCSRRGHCRQAVARTHYQQAVDLVVCDHALFFRDLWTRNEALETGLRPILPAYSGVVFDEGHEIPEAAQLTAGYVFQQAELERTVDLATAFDDRDSLQSAADDVRSAASRFWTELHAGVVSADLERCHVKRSPSLDRMTVNLATAIESLQDELAIEEAMFEGDELAINLLAFQARLDEAAAGLRLMRRDSAQTVLWVEEAKVQAERRLWIVPRQIGARLQKELYSQGVPAILSSGTLASADSFDYMKRVLGAPNAQHTQVGVPFDLGTQALIYLPEGNFSPVERLVEVLHQSQGRALVLMNSKRDLQELRRELKGVELPWTLLWEGDLARAELVRRFKADQDSVLFGTSFWEGIDVPGESLSCVVMMKLPFPAHDPVIVARREDAEAAGLDPFEAVDVPAMAIKLKQGRGRLIRTEKDRGVAALLDTSWRGSGFEEAVLASFPDDSETSCELSRVGQFLTAEDEET